MNQVLDAKVRPLVVASQLGKVFNDRIAQRVPGLAFADLSRGDFDIGASDAEILLAMPLRAPEIRALSQPPAVWPGAIRWVQLFSAGSDGYPRWLFDGPIVTCARGPSAHPIAEYVFATILSAARQLPQIWAHSPEEWERNKLRTRDVAGATLGLIGFGAIGRRIAELALPFGFRVVAHRRTDAPLGIDGVERAPDIGALLAQSDYAVLALPATPQTYRIIDKDVLAQAKRGVHFINVARGSLIDQEALLDSLNSGVIGLASLDVTDPEPLPEGHPFYTHPRVQLSPHISMITDGAFDKLIDKLVDNINCYRERRPLPDIVDPDRGY